MRDPESRWRAIHILNLVNLVENCDEGRMKKFCELKDHCQLRTLRTEDHTAS